MRDPAGRQWGGCGAIALGVLLAGLGARPSFAIPSSPPAATSWRGAVGQNPDPAAIRAELEALLRQITAAVGAADQAGYLSHVSQTDPCFAKEQENWAKDFSRKSPERFEVALTEAEITLAEDGTAEGRLKWSWRVAGGRDRSLSFVGRFVRTETGWLYAGEKWHVLDGDRCRVSYADGLEDAAKTVAEILPEVRAHVHEGFQLEADKDLTERIQQVKLYGSMRHLQHSIYLSYSDGLGGWNEPGEAVKVLGRAGSAKGSLRTLLGHEYGHVATFQLGPKATDMPWWILEGVAELSAEAYSRDEKSAERTVKRWAANDALVEWDRLANFHGEATEHMAQVYTQGHHMLSYISTRFGREGRNRWLRELAQGTMLDEATTRALGLSFADLDKDWRASLESKPESPPAAQPDKVPSPPDRQ